MRVVFQWIAALIFCQAAIAADKVTLKDVKTSWSKDSFITELHFDGAVLPEHPTVEFINQTIQVNIPNAQVPGGQKYIKIDKNNLKSVFSYQLSDKMMRSRIIYEKPIEAGQFKGAVKISGVENVLRIQVQDPTKTVSVVKSEKSETLPVVPPVNLNNEVEKALAAAADIEATELSDAAKIVAAEMTDKKSPTKTDTINDDLKEAIALGKKAEEEIPVLTKSAKVEKPIEGAYSRMLISLAVIAVIGGGIVLFTRRYVKRHPSQNHNTIKVLTQHSLGPKKSLAIIRVAGESILIGVTEQNINMIKSLSLLDEDLPAVSTDSFQMNLDVQNEVVRRPSEKGSEDEFSVTQVKDMVSSKLKEMRQI